MALASGYHNKSHSRDNYSSYPRGQQRPLHIVLMLVEFFDGCDADLDSCGGLDKKQGKVVTLGGEDFVNTGSDQGNTCTQTCPGQEFRTLGKHYDRLRSDKQSEERVHYWRAGLDGHLLLFRQQT